MRAGAAGGGREKPAFYRRAHLTGGTAASPAGGLLSRRPGAACVPIADGGGRTGSAGIVPRQW
ncbi:hypothetical protein WL88_13245 [Burkholderia diffusa]|uniref:Uncharacterized protein n=1 Tax=Burkholderia diffusa TaxID=488732 RepID=A0AAW3PHJ9_9BURK|nr:hypothetical protein WL85_17330 [Burkholderia diffusa]KWF47651.1 hypothetical protein WL86_03065 [Burkholderia diffusa]KWF52561.1 hypothetical protein WL87_00595 [Burkholderia diffusa]KWF55117.1 hypothetical protein WL88_13245 [Burkholderia diffusa]